MMPHSKEEKAGELYSRAMDAVKQGGDSIKRLATHIELIVEGTKDFPGPLWKERILEPDKKHIHLDNFEDYLFKPARVGLGLESYFQLNNILVTCRNGDNAIRLIKREIPDYDEHVRKDQARLDAKNNGGKGKDSPGPSKGTINNPDGVGGKSGKTASNIDNVDNINIIKDERPSGTSKEYLLRRLHREARDVFDDYEQGKYPSVRAAAIAAGIIKVQSPYEMIGKQLAKLNRLELMDLQARITAILQEQ